MQLSDTNKKHDFRRNNDPNYTCTLPNFYISLVTCIYTLIIVTTSTYLYLHKPHNSTRLLTNRLKP